MLLDAYGWPQQNRAGERAAWIIGLCLLSGLFWAQGPEQVHAERRPVSPDSLSISTVSTIAYVRASDQPGKAPDLRHDTVTVRGRISAEPGVFPDSTIAFLQDQTAGIAVRLPENTTVQRGDLLRVRGVVHYENGLTYLDGLSTTTGRVLAWKPDPMPTTVSTATRGNYEGRLVRVQGQVATKRNAPDGHYLVLTDGKQHTDHHIAVFVRRSRTAPNHFEQFAIGDDVQITGILSRYADSPVDVAHLVFPRDRRDLEEESTVSSGTQTIILFVVGGTLFAVIALMTLRSAVRQRNQQLVESRARFRRLAEATREGIILHRDGDILDVNRALTEMTGYNRGDLVDRPLSDVLSDSVPELDREALQNHSEDTYETVVRREDGSTFPAAVDDRVVATGNKRVHVIAIRNITEQKRRETELREAKEEAEQMARLKSSLLNNMSHEFRTPITSILGYADLILDEPEADHHNFAQQIRNSGKRLSRTLRAVLEMAQIEGGQLDVQPGPVDIGSLVRTVVDEHRSENGPSFEITGTTDTVHTDRHLVRRVLENLIHNATKFTPDTGQVTVTIESTESSVTVAVSDSGVGIDPAFQDDLFSPFKQESTGRTRTHEGMGLGLSLTKRMLDLLDGTIEVESEKGEGSTFTVGIPARSPESTPPPPTQKADSS